MHNPAAVGTHSVVPHLKYRDHHPGLPIHGNCSQCPQLWENLIHPQGLATQKLFLSTFATSAPDIGEVPRLCFLTGRHPGENEEITVVFCPLTHYSPN
ncbi:hypothetical protein CCH79_00010037 [Gambusia affinis]|uniref:Uncharacterized protein n=1 Tax=Gambusia affinis TaxID=33528 RepID=A0A315VNE1_GAMAF|nr:hypothetical protein CCH79_00010037 [Gambusia affinis]